MAPKLPVIAEQVQKKRKRCDPIHPAIDSGDTYNTEL